VGLFVLVFWYLVVGGVLVVLVLVVCGGVLCLYLLGWGGQGWGRRVRV
jgi:hypothetical protein